MLKKEAYQGRSASSCDYILEKQLQRIKPNSIVDFGAGGGKNGHIIRDTIESGVYILAIEANSHTVDMLKKCKLYDEIFYGMIQNWLHENSKNYDLAIFGDVLEHLKPREIHRVIRACLRRFRHIIIVCPLYSIYNLDSHDNPLEEHQTYVTESYFDKYAPAEKHIIRDTGYIIMNVLLISENKNVQLYRKATMSIFHKCMILLQWFGVAKYFADIVKMISDRYKAKIRNNGA